MDLALRKLSMKKGTIFAGFIAQMDDVINKAKSNPELKKYAEQLDKTKTLILDVPKVFAEKTGQGQIYYSFLQASPFIEAAGDVIISWFLLWAAEIAQEKLNNLFKENGAAVPEKQKALIINNKNAAFYSGKVQAAKFFIGNILPITDGRLEAIKWGDASAWDICEQAFGH